MSACPEGDREQMVQENLCLRERQGIRVASSTCDQNPRQRDIARIETLPQGARERIVSVQPADRGPLQGRIKLPAAQGKADRKQDQYVFARLGNWKLRHVKRFALQELSGPLAV